MCKCVILAMFLWGLGSLLGPSAAAPLVGFGFALVLFWFALAVVWFAFGLLWFAFCITKTELGTRRNPMARRRRRPTARAAATEHADRLGPCDHLAGAAAVEGGEVHRGIEHREEAGAEAAATAAPAPAAAAAAASSGASDVDQ